MLERVLGLDRRGDLIGPEQQNDRYLLRPLDYVGLKRLDFDVEDGGLASINTHKGSKQVGDSNRRIRIRLTDPRAFQGRSSR